MSGKYGEYRDGIQKYWYVARLWKLAEDLPIEDISISEIKGPDEVTWFGGSIKPTCNAIVEHCKRILNADITYPVILTEDNCVFDGMHRIARHIMENKTTIKVKKFRKNPEPDEVFQR